MWFPLKWLFGSPHAHIFARAFLGQVLAIAGGSKLFNLNLFALYIAQYELLPAAWTKPIAWLIPPVELITALLLISGLWAPGGAVAAACLFTAFGFAVAVNLLRGRTEITCGCFVLGARHPISWSLVLRNSLFAGAAIFSIRWMGETPNCRLHLFCGLPSIEVLEIVFVATASICIWWLANTLRAAEHVGDSAGS